MSEVNARNEAEKAQRQMERAAKTAHMKEVKQQVKEAAQKQAQDMDAYVMLSFDTWETKADFCRRFGYDPYNKYIPTTLVTAWNIIMWNLLESSTWSIWKVDSIQN